MATLYVYKFRVANTGYFYFGITTNLERRRTSHYSRINSFVNTLIHIPAHLRVAESGHAAVAKKIVHGKRSLNNEDLFSKKQCSITILFSFENVKDAVDTETALISKHKNNTKCFNTEKESRYYVRQFNKKV